MFARILEFPVRMEKKEEFVSLFKNEVLPILKKQPGFLEMIPLFPEIKKEKVITISLWTDKRDAERYHRNAYPRNSPDPEAIPARRSGGEAVSGGDRAL
jgi:heme-degrading monooxygenase HmoA